MEDGQRRRTRHLREPAALRQVDGLNAAGSGVPWPRLPSPGRSISRPDAVSRARDGQTHGASKPAALTAPSYPKTQMWSLPPEAFQYGYVALMCAWASTYIAAARATRYLTRGDCDGERAAGERYACKRTLERRAWGRACMPCSWGGAEAGQKQLAGSGGALEREDGYWSGKTGIGVARGVLEWKEQRTCGVSKMCVTMAHEAYTGTKNQSASVGSVVRCGDDSSHSCSSSSSTWMVQDGPTTTRRER